MGIDHAERIENVLVEIFLQRLAGNNFHQVAKKIRIQAVHIG